jgi:hypothetical protein
LPIECLSKLLGRPQTANTFFKVCPYRTIQFWASCATPDGFHLLFLAQGLHIDRRSNVVIAVPKHGSDLLCEDMKRLAGDLGCKAEAIPASALGADVATLTVLVVKPKPVIPATDRAWPVLVDEIAAIHAKGWQDLLPAALC